MTEWTPEEVRDYEFSQENEYTERHPERDNPVTDAVVNQDRDGLFTLRQYLTIAACVTGANVWSAVEAVHSTAIEHPEWDLDEQRTWDEWIEWDRA